MNDEVYSYHIFMFPFTWDFKKTDATEQNRSTPEDVIKKIGPNPKWEKVDTKSSEILDYNAQEYFHGFVHPALGITQGDELTSNYTYNLDKGKTSYYKISIHKKLPEEKEEQPTIFQKPKQTKTKPTFKQKLYSLRINSITLSINQLGVGVLSFHLENPLESGSDKAQTPEDVLMINQYGRRISPPFLDKYFKDFDSKQDHKPGSDPTCLGPLDGVQHRELPISIEITLDGEPLITEKFESFPKVEGGKIPDSFKPEHIDHFLKSAGGFTYEKILDDRMFVVSWFGAEQLTFSGGSSRISSKAEEKKYGTLLSNLCERIPGGYEVGGFYRNNERNQALSINTTHNGYGYAQNDFWYRYVFVDGTTKSCQNQLLQVEQIEKHTYARWAEFNTLFGVTRYSFVCITEPQKELHKPSVNAAFIVDHMKTLYFRMASLCLMQRALVLKFSKNATEISNKISEKEQNKISMREITNLLLLYTKFINRVHHREVSAQEQGIELYDMLSQHLRIEYQSKELEKEINELHRNMEIVRNWQTEKYRAMLSKIASAFAVPSVIFAISNYFTQSSPTEIDWHHLPMIHLWFSKPLPYGKVWASIAIISFILYYLIRYILTDEPGTCILRKWCAYLRKWRGNSSTEDNPPTHSRGYAVTIIACAFVSYLIIFPSIQNDTSMLIYLLIVWCLILGAAHAIILILEKKKKKKKKNS